MRFIFAGDRDIAVWVLQDLVERGLRPDALLVSGEDRASHANELIELAALPKDRVLVGQEFNKEHSIELMRSLRPDYIIGIHFPYIIKKKVLDIPQIGVLNLHPAYLPYNRGWHTPTWAIAEQTPVGATLHFMSESLDMGDIVARLEVEVLQSDTANSLYGKLKLAERELFRSTIDSIANKQLLRSPQKPEEGNSHKARDLFSSPLRQIDLDKEYNARELLRLLRAFSTNKAEEGMYYIIDDVQYNIQINITRNDK